MFKEIHESEKVRTSTKRLRVVLDAKYEKADLDKVMKNQRQKLIETQRNEFIKLSKKSKNCLMEQLAPGK